MNWTVTRRIALGFGLSLALLVVTAVTGVVALRVEAARYEEALRGQREVLLVGGASAVFLNRAVSLPLRRSSTVLASTAAEILAATTQQAAGAAESSAAVTETVATVDEVAHTAEQAVERAQAVAHAAQSAGEMGRDGRAARATHQIVASAGQQAAGMVQIRQARGNIQEATAQNLASTRQAERAAQDLTELGRKLVAVVGGKTAKPPFDSHGREAS